MKVALCAALILGGCLAGCEIHEATATADDGLGGEDGETGTIEVALSVGEAEFPAFDYIVTGNGFDKTGSIDVSGSQTVSAVIGPIPFGMSYHVSLHGQSTSQPVLTCTGSSSFDIVTGGVLPVNVAVQCKAAGAGAPSAVPVPGAAHLALLTLLLGIGAGLVSRKQSAVQS